jgi:hypothetical protein
MAISSVPFLLCLLLLTAIFFVIPTAAIRKLILFSCNICFISLALPNFASVYVVIAFLGSGFLMARLLGSYSSRWILGIYFIVLVSFFAALQNY